MVAFLQLPIFDDEFARALCRLGLGRSEFWLALDAEVGADDQIAQMLGAMGGIRRTGTRYLDVLSWYLSCST